MEVTPESAAHEGQAKSLPFAAPMRFLARRLQ
jgi:hypothetical protein